MPIQCSAFNTEQAAQAAVERLMVDGTPGDRITVMSGHPVTDHRQTRAGSFAGSPSGSLGVFAGAPGSAADGMSDFAGERRRRRGSYSDADRDIVITYPEGVRREHIASHRELERRLVSAGLDARQAAADVSSLHHGCVLVVVTPA